MKAFKPYFLFLISLSFVLTLSQCLVEDRQEDVEFSTSTIVDDLLENPKLSVFTGVLGHGQFLKSFTQMEEVTLLAPSNEVMTKYIDSLLATDTTWNILSDIPALTFNKTFQRILQYHILPDQTVLTENLANGEVVISSTGVGLVVDKTNGTKFTRINDTDFSCNVQVGNIIEDNGVVHIVDNLLGK